MKEKYVMLSDAEFLSKKISNCKNYQKGSPKPG